MKERVVIVGLDGASYELIGRLILQNKMTNLASLGAKGIRGPLKSILPPQSVPVWPCFASGMNPGKLGVYGFFKLERGYDIRPCSSHDTRGMTMWDYLSSLGRRTFLVNVPLTYPPYEINGIMISGFPAPPGPEGTDGLQCFPESLAAGLREIAPGYKMEAAYKRGQPNEDQILRMLYDTLEQRRKVVLHLLKDESWDLFIAVFSCSDRIQHMFFRHLDPNHPAGTEDGRRKYGNAIDEFFEALDDVLGSVLRAVGDSTTTVVLSDHGHSPQIAHVGVNQLLAQLGMLKYHASYRLGITKSSLFTKLNSMGLLRLAKGIPQKFRSLVPVGIDFSHSTAYCYCFGAINLNLKGRDPQGVVEKADYETVREDLIRLLLGYVDPETGKPIVERVFRREEIYWGDRLDSAPDVLAVFRDGFGPRSWNPNGRAIQRIDASEFDLAKPIVENGGHHWLVNMDGIFFARGNSIKRGAEIRGARIIDIAPTVLHLLSIPIPGNMDGRVLPIFDEESCAARRPVQYSGPLTGSGPAKRSWSSEDEMAVMKRLADLGYMG